MKAASHSSPVFLVTWCTPGPLLQAPGMTAAELTAANLDRSAVLEDVIARAYGGDKAGLLGELQARCSQSACSGQCSESCCKHCGPVYG